MINFLNEYIYTKIVLPSQFMHRYAMMHLLSKLNPEVLNSVLECNLEMLILVQMQEKDAVSRQ